MAKDVVKHYRLTTDDAAAFRKKAEEAGMTESDYFRLLITQQPSDYPEIRGGIKVLINEVNRIGVNINEIVFNNNSNLYRTADTYTFIDGVGCWILAGYNTISDRYCVCKL